MILMSFMFILIFLAVLGTMAWRYVRRVRYYNFIEHLDAALRSGHPLTRGLRDIANYEKGRLADCAHRVLEHMERGETFDQALNAIRRQIPPEDQRWITWAMRTGQLKPTLHALRDDHQRALNQRTGLHMQMIAITSALLVMVIMSIYLWHPPSSRFMDDFDVEQTMWVDYLPGMDLPAQTIKVMLLIWVFVAAPLVLSIFLFRRLRQHSPWWNLYFQLTRWTPGNAGLLGERGWVWCWVGCWVGCWVSWRAWGAFSRSMQFAMAAGMPLRSAMTHTMGLYEVGPIRRQLRRWLLEMEQGRDIHTAATRAGIPKLVRNLLGRATDGDAAAAAMRFCHRYYTNRLETFMLWVHRTVPITITFIVALMVGWYAWQFVQMVMEIYERQSW